MKKSLCLVLAFLLTVCLIPNMAFTASAKVSGDYEYYILSDGTAEITYYNGSATTLKIPSKLDGYKVTKIDFWGGCEDITSVTIPDSVKSIGWSAFEDCESLKSITIPDSVKSIGESAFKNCTALKTITIPDSVTSIESYAFEGCHSLKTITIPDSVKSIGWSAFEDTAYYNNRSNWKNNILYIGNHLIVASYYDEDKDEFIYASGSIKIKDGTKTIADAAFSCCEDITSVTIPDSVTSIGRETFSGCEALKTITIPDSVTSIGVSAFYFCSNLRSVSLPKKLKKIGEYAFSGTDLRTVTIPNTVNFLGSEAFGFCKNLESITLPKNIKEIDYQTFVCCEELKTVVIPYGVETVADGAFVACKNLTAITISNSVIEIGSGAFQDCPKLKAVTIPSSVKEIEAEAFGYVYESGKNKKLSGFTIYGKKDTEAERYAKLNGFTFKTAVSTKLAKTSITLGVGETYTLKTTKGNAPFKYSSGKSSVATVSSKGKITAKKSGTATITVTSNSGKKATCKVTVKKAPTSVKLNKKSITLGVGETFDLNSTVNSGAASYNTTYSSGKSSVASVKSAGGLVTAKKVGTATIKVKTYNGKTATCKVTVKKAPTKVSLNKKSITLKVGQTFDLNSTVNSGTASYTSSYSSSKSSVASVKSAGGLVTAKKVGTATITVKTFNGKKATCKVTVKK